MKKFIKATAVVLAISALFTFTASASSIFETFGMVTNYRTYTPTREEVLKQVNEQAKGQTPPSNTVSNAPTERIYPQQPAQSTSNSTARNTLFDLLLRG